MRRKDGKMTDDRRYKIINADCLDAMREMPADSVDAIVTDPPYGLEFMGKDWDHGVPGEAFWREALRVAKPGAHLLAFGGTRTYHRLTCAIEDAGWDIRDCVMWVYGSGFPKSHDVSKAIDKASGAEREVVGVGKRNMMTEGKNTYGTWDESGRFNITAPATDAARQWAGWGTALKPAWEPIIVARKPLIGTVADNVLEYGTGVLNIDGCRVEAQIDDKNKRESSRNTSGKGVVTSFGYSPNYNKGSGSEFIRLGRWPANVIHDGSDEVTGLFPETTSMGHRPRSAINGGIWGNGKNPKLSGEPNNGHNDSGSAARFFYCAKASKRDRDEGCEGMEERIAGSMIGNSKEDTQRLAGDGVTPVRQVIGRNHHPTVKPTALMRYLCRLVTPPCGTVLDPFMGSGSTGKAAILEGFSFIGIDREAEYCAIAGARCAHAASLPPERAASPVAASKADGGSESQTGKQWPIKSLFE